MHLSTGHNFVKSLLITTDIWYYDMWYDSAVLHLCVDEAPHNLAVNEKSSRTAVTTYKKGYKPKPLSNTRDTAGCKQSCCSSCGIYEVFLPTSNVTAAVIFWWSSESIQSQNCCTAHQYQRQWSNTMTQQAYSIQQVCLCVCRLPSILSTSLSPFRRHDMRACWRISRVTHEVEGGRAYPKRENWKSQQL